MNNKARNYKITTIKRLFMQSGGQCAFPNCTRKMIAEDGKTVVGEIAHIQAANKNGARYYPLISDEERADFPNLMLLCDEHHKMIDNKENENIYTIELLKKWKAEHEAKNEKDPFQVSDEVIKQITNKLEEYLQDFADKFIEATLEADKTILDEIFEYIFNEKIDEENARVKFEKDGKDITEKIKVNFDGSHRKRVAQIVSDYFKYEHIIRNFVQIEAENNSFRIDALKDVIQDTFCEIRNTQDTESKIENFNVFKEIAQKLLPINKQYDTKYVFNAKLIVVYFFEFCEIGKKTEAENNSNQLKFEL